MSVKFYVFIFCRSAKHIANLDINQGFFMYYFTDRFY